LSNHLSTDNQSFPRHYKKATFISQLVEIIRKLHVPSWIASQIFLEDITIHKVSGSLTNAVFFVSCPTVSSVSTLLLRIYGSSSGSLISRPKELQTLHTLSSQYNIGARVYGTFENGRIEEYFDSVTLTPSDIRNPQISRWIGARMAELHSVDIDVVDGTSDGGNFRIGANVNSWVTSAKEVLRLPSVSESTRQELDLSRFMDEWNRYFAWATREGRGLGSKRVFAHNDTQYGNILRLKDRGYIDGNRQVCAILPSNVLSDLNL
jgi:choline kinase